MEINSFELSNKEVGQELRWKKFPVLDQGYVCLVDWMGDDLAVVQAARVSYGAGTKKTSDDRSLIRYLYRHAHMTPFEMAEVKLLVFCPMDLWRQWIRHRTAAVNEYSTRYSEAIDAAQRVPGNRWRKQSDLNKQGSGGFLEANDEKGDPGDGIFLSNREEEFQKFAREIYEERLKFGVAREQARKDLPLSTYTVAYWKSNLRNLFNFLSLRMDSHAQIEIRSYANIIGQEIVSKLFPYCWGAFEDYDHRRKGLLLSAQDTEVIQILEKQEYTKGTPESENWFMTAANQVGWGSEKNRERDECREKLKRLGII